MGDEEKASGPLAWIKTAKDKIRAFAYRGEPQRSERPRVGVALAGCYLAMLEDRVRTGDGKKQLYGTQVNVGPDGKPRVSPIEDPKNLDARRAAVGLPPIGVYLDRMQSEFGQEIDRSALTIEDNSNVVPGASMETAHQR